MPKDVSERIIDSPFALTTRLGSVSIGGGGGGGGGGATNLDALTDVTLSAPSSGQTLSYNGSQWVNAAPAAMTAHALSGAFHTGLLNWSLINFSGSSLGDLATRSHSLLTGIAPDDHHDHVHPLIGSDSDGIAQHTATGLTTGNVVRASGPTTFAWAQLQHTDLGNVLPDQHHERAHNIITGDSSGAVHTITGSQFQVVGATAANVLGLLTPTPTPGAAAAILRTDANGGIQLDTNLFYVDGANNWIGVNRTPSGATLDLIAAANADHTQRIKMKSGQTARLWRIEDLSGNELIVLDSVGNLQSGRPGFVSGLTGWQITPQGNAEFNNIWARGELHATVFVKDEVHATGGTLLVATAGTLYDDAVISSSTVDDDTLVVYSTPAGQGVPLQVVTTSGTFTGTDLHVSWIGNFINVNDPPSGPGFYFQPGDIIRSKTEVPTGVTDFWLEVNSAVQNSGYATYSITKRSGTDGTLPKGSALVSYGKEGDGRILMTSDLNYAPYIDVFTVGPNVWTGNAGSVLPRMRMGRLDGIGLPGVSGVTQYGMIAGKDLSDANSGYLIASNLQFSLYKVDIRLNNGVSDTGLWTADGNLKIGSNIGAAATTGLSVFTTGGRSGDVVIGNEATGNFMRWQQATGILTVSGSLIVSDPGTTVTKTYVDNQDSYYDNLAGGTYNSNGVLGGYALVGQTTATAYSDARRIVGVTGSWDSPTATTIRWGTKAVTATPAGVAMSAAFGNASNRAIADHAAASISVTSRTYLFVSVAGTGTMTMTPTTSLATVMASPNNVLIAVADPGNSSTKACSITVVAGSTYISGSNIFTGSIVAANIATGTITANEIAGTTITSAKLASDVTGAISSAEAKGQQGIDDAAAAATAAGNAQTNAQTYGNARRVVGVSGTWGSNAYNTIFWTGASVRFGDGTSKTLAGPSGAGGNTATFSGRVYFVVNVTSAEPLTVAMVTSIDSIGINHALIAVADAGTPATGVPATSGSGFATVQMMAGSTYISGDNIITGSIVAGNIAARGVTADRLSVNRLDGMSLGTVYTGILELDGGSNIHSAGKAYNNGVAGVFLGRDGAAYKLDVGSSSAGLLWDGANLFLTTNQAIGVRNTSTGQILSMNGPGASTGLLTLDSAGLLTFTGSGAHFNANRISADKLIVTAGTIQIEDPRLDIIHNNSAGAVGDIAWSVTGTGGGEQVYLYICYAVNKWVRMLFPLTTW